MDKNHSCIKEKDFAQIDGRLTLLEERDKRFDKTIEKLNETQEHLVTEMEALRSVLNTLKYVGGILIALFGGIFVFMVTEIIKIIH